MNRLVCAVRRIAHVTTPPVEPPSCIRKFYFDKIERPQRAENYNRGDSWFDLGLDRPLPFCLDGKRVVVRTDKSYEHTAVD